MNTANTAVPESLLDSYAAEGLELHYTTMYAKLQWNSILVCVHVCSLNRNRTVCLTCWFAFACALPPLDQHYAAKQSATPIPRPCAYSCAVLLNPTLASLVDTRMAKASE